MAEVVCVEVGPRAEQPDPHGEAIRAQVTALTGTDPGRTRVHHLYWLKGAIGPTMISEIARELLADRVVEDWAIGDSPSGTPYSSAIAYAVKPGVTDPAAAHVLMGIRDLGIGAVAEVVTGARVLFEHPLTPAHSDVIGPKLLFNPTIQRALDPGDDPFRTPPPQAPTVATVPLTTLDDEGLLRLSKEGLLALTLAEMGRVKAHFISIGREPTDAELETLAQTWSEHCVHKTLKGRYILPDRQYENLLKDTIFAATQELDLPWCLSVFADNAGVISFVDDLAVCFKVETHNHPSAVEPYGGAGTGIGGVIRDVLGTGLGAHPIGNTDIFCFADPRPGGNPPPPNVLHPARVMRGVVNGVRDYGNRMGIPTINGALYFHPDFITNPLVFCGTIGLLPTDKIAKAARPGDRIALIGGATGRDGIHGATFSSLTLDHTSEETAQGAVQIGNPIMEKKVMDALIKARDADLMTAVTDCGAGGLSSAVGEMGAELGARVQLETVPLKYQGLAPWEIWVSEAQERMVASVPKDKWDHFAAIMAGEEVPCTAIGTFTGDGDLHVTYNDLEVAHLPMALLHEELPKREFHPVIRSRETEATPPETGDYATMLLKLLAHPCIASHAWVVRQYDHEVQGMSALKPLVGPSGEGPGDGAVLRPLSDRPEGLTVTNGLCPRYGHLNAYQMTLNALDEAVRGAIAIGADPERIALLDNFAWGSVDTPEDQGDLLQAAEACRDGALAYRAPFISGKDSLHNEYSTPQGRRSIPPTMLISALGRIPDVAHAVSSDLKTPTNLIFLLGLTQDRWGGSLYAELMGMEGGTVPRVDLDANARLYRALHEAIRQGWIRSCHDLSEGGLLVALAEMAIGGGWGLRLDLQNLLRVHAVPLAAACFAEGPGRLLIEVAPEDRLKIETHFRDHPLVAIAQVDVDPLIHMWDPSHQKLFEVPLATAREAFLSFSMAQGLKFAPFCPGHQSLPGQEASR